MLNYIVCRGKIDYPTEFYEDTHYVYLCILKSGKTLICKYSKGNKNGVWESVSNSKENIEEVVAYKRFVI